MDPPMKCNAYRERWAADDHAALLTLFTIFELQTALGLHTKKKKTSNRKYLTDQFKKSFDVNDQLVKLKRLKAETNLNEWEENTHLLALISSSERQELLGEEIKDFSKTKQQKLNHRFKQLIPVNHSSIVKKHSVAGYTMKEDLDVSTPMPMGPSPSTMATRYWPLVGFCTPTGEEFFTPTGEEPEKRSPNVDAKKVLAFSHEAEDSFSGDVDEEAAPCIDINDASADVAMALLGMARSDDTPHHEDEPHSSLDIDQKRMLLQLFVPATMDWESVVNERWHLKSKDTSLIHKVFQERFGHRVRRSNLADIYEKGAAGTKKVLDVLEAVLEDKRRAKDVAYKEFASVNSKQNRAIDAMRALKLSLDPIGLLLRDVHNLLGKKGTELAHDGSSTYAEPRQNNINHLCHLLLDKKLVSDKDVVVDFGSGAMTALVHMCQIWRCRGIGVEYSENRVHAAASYMRRLFTLHQDDPSFNPHVVCFVANIMAMERMLQTATILYMFDEAFPPELMTWICKMIQSAPPTLRIVIAAKAMKYSDWKNRFPEDAGLYCLMEPVHCTKIGSGESSTLCIYGRNGLEYDEGLGLFPRPDGKPAPSVSQKLSIVQDLTSLDMMAQNFYASTTATKIKYYEALIESTHNSMSAKRKCKKKSGSACSTEYEMSLDDGKDRESFACKRSKLKAASRM
jgi:hypothetical protein